jgi:hypothetical protein
MTIEEAKAKYPNSDIFTLTVNDRNGNPITVLLREMDRVAYKSISALIAKDELLGVESLLKTLCIDGDVSKIIDDFKAFRSATQAILPILQAEAGELKKN